MSQSRQMTLRHPLVRVFAIDLVPELVRTGRAHEEVERSRPETVALSDRLQPAYLKVLERNPGGGVGSGLRQSVVMADEGGLTDRIGVRRTRDSETMRFSSPLDLGTTVPAAGSSPC